MKRNPEKNEGKINGVICRRCKKNDIVDRTSLEIGLVSAVIPFSDLKNSDNF